MGCGSDQEAPCTRNALSVAFSWMCPVRIRSARAIVIIASETSVCIVRTMSGATGTLCVHPSRFLSQVYETVQRILRVRRLMGRRGHKDIVDGGGYNKGYKICRPFQRGRF